MRKIDKYLKEFNQAQINKFEKRKNKHTDDNVIDDNTDWSKLSFMDLYNHFMDEIVEFENAATPARMRDEAIDVANMAFLLWKRIELGGLQLSY